MDKNENVEKIDISSSSEEENFESDLGNKDHWDTTYDEEISQFLNNRDEIGYVWYGKQVQNKTVQYIKNNFTNKDIKILDIGCGNGALLFELINIGFSNLKGMDYSEKSIELACNIKNYKISQGEKLCEKIEFYTEDINEPLIENKEYLYDLILDKGTFDAYMLNKDNSYLNYSKYIKTKMNDKSILIISSCNHLKKDLLEYFTNSENNQNFGFELVEEIPHKSFNFGGSIGQSVTTLVFKINK